MSWWRPRRGHHSAGSAADIEEGSSVIIVMNDSLDNKVTSGGTRTTSKSKKNDRGPRSGQLRLRQQHQLKRREGNQEDEDANSVASSTNSILSKSSRSSASSRGRFRVLNMGWLSVLIVGLGAVTTAAFLGIGIRSAISQQTEDFVRAAADTTNQISAAFEEYVTAASLIHYSCRDRTFTRQDFRQLFEYVWATGLRFKAMQFDPNITHAERDAAEAEARAYYATNYPHVNYQGFRGFNTLDSKTLEPRTNQSFYFPIHYQEPIPGNEAAIDLDYYSSESRIRAVRALFENQSPSLTDRLSLVKQAGSVSRCGDHDGPSYGVVLMHPGVNLTTQPDVWPKDFSSIVLCIPDLLRHSTEDQSKPSMVYIHDRSQPNVDSVFMGGASVVLMGDDEPVVLQESSGVSSSSSSKSKTVVTFLDEILLEDIPRGRFFFQENVTAANRIWTITIINVPGTFKPNIVFVIVGGSLICIASICLAIWMTTNSRNITKYNTIKAQSEAERAALVIDSARQAARAERELNDFIAHEVRNPVAAAMAATSFLKTALFKQPVLPTRETQEQAQEDVVIVENSLQFVNELLRNMLDMHRASTKQLQVNMAPTDLLRDVLQPVGGMLHQRSRGSGGTLAKVKLLVECPEDLFVMTDCLRLKQIVMNLGRNSCKFIDTGFIRLKAEVITIDDGDSILNNKKKRKVTMNDDEHGNNAENCTTPGGMTEGDSNRHVRLYVDDSGSGIPYEKRQRLFAKFQESLDALNQGTGIGLYLCKLLMELMGGEIYLDDNYDSGIPGHPGTRFVLDLKRPPLVAPPPVLHEMALPPSNENKASRTLHATRNGAFSSTSTTEDDDCDELPEHLSVLFVDDDRILRKLFARSVRTLVPGWTVHEAANGEAAVLMTTEEEDEKDPPVVIEQFKDDEDVDEVGNTIMRETPPPMPRKKKNRFDLIFIDMYMASVEKQMLGTETVVALREHGVTSRICGLSANDKREEFEEAGADAFMFKPFPCERDALHQELCRILFWIDKEKDEQKKEGDTHHTNGKVSIQTKPTSVNDMKVMTPSYTTQTTSDLDQPSSLNGSNRGVGSYQNSKSSLAA